MSSLNHLELQKLLDQIGDRFEDDWSEAERPCFDHYFGELEKKYHSAVLEELIRVDVQLRVKAGQQVKVDDYRSVEPDGEKIASRLLLDEESDDFLSVPSKRETIQDIGDQTEVDFRPVPSIKGYRLIKKLGQGGMGTVWLAEQDEPIKRRLAIKVIRGDLDCKQVIKRFEGERRALAVMDHPNIARIIEAGKSSFGQPFFAMEWVDGPTLTDYCNQQKLDLRERLRLFLDVCSAVQHAHHKGVIHRDLKPNNILIATVDQKPVPKIIDFGLAKALESSQVLVDQSMHTAIGQIIGTLKYMSPEQATMLPKEVDKRSDVYSLGVILYQLLVGSTPIETADIADLGLYEALQVIREHEIELPSRRLERDQQISQIARERNSGSSSLLRELLNDLDWIVFKALDKDRDRRYRNVADLSNDIRRFLSDEPVNARPPTWRYRASKFVSKNRGLVIAASLVFLTMLAGIIGTSYGLYQTRIRASQAEKSNEILKSIFEDLGMNVHQEELGSLGFELVRRIKAAAARLELDEVAADPVTIANLKLQLGRTLLSFGIAKEALPMLEESIDVLRGILGEKDKQVLLAEHSLARAYNMIDSPQKSLPLLTRNVDLTEKVFGKDHENGLLAQTYLAKALELDYQHEQALALVDSIVPKLEQAVGKSHRYTLNAMMLGVGIRLTMNRHVNLARTDIEEVIKRLERRPAGILESRAKGLLAAICRYEGEMEKAINLDEQSVAAMESKLGVFDPRAILRRANLANAYLSDGQLEKAARDFEHTYDSNLKLFGIQHGNTLFCLRGLIGTKLRLGESDQALQLVDQILAGNENGFEEISINALQYHKQIVGYLLQHDYVAKAREFADDLFTRAERRFGQAHELTLESGRLLTQTLIRNGKVVDGLAFYDNVLAEVEAQTSIDNRLIRVAMKRYAGMLSDERQFEKAAAIAYELVDLDRAKFGDTHEATLASTQFCFFTLKNSGRFDECFELLEPLIAALTEKYGREDPRTHGVLFDYADLLDRVERLPESLAIIEEIDEAGLFRQEKVGGFLNYLRMKLAER